MCPSVVNCYLVQLSFLEVSKTKKIRASYFKHITKDNVYISRLPVSTNNFNLNAYCLLNSS
jgi:hypothetical protein